jgi:hypothetical protein
MPIRLWRRSKPVVASLAIATGLMIGSVHAADADCHWIVQPHFGTMESEIKSPLVDIVFDGLNDAQPYFYAFTVADDDLAWRLAAAGALSDLGPDGRALDLTKTPSGQAFQLDSESIQPHTVYLVAASSPVGELERIDAAIEPSRPFAVSQLKTRGGTDVSGPLPNRSLPGYEIRAADVKTPVDDWLRTQKERLLADRNSDESAPPKTVNTDGDDPTLASNVRYEEDGRRDVQICAYQVAMH